MQQIVLQKLDWFALLEKLSALASTDEAKERLLSLQPNKTAEEILETWEKVEPLKALFIAGYKPPLGQLPPFESLLRSGQMRQALSGEELRLFASLLEITRSNHNFAKDFSKRSSALQRYASRTYDLPNTYKAITRAIEPDGELSDNASPELKRIRNQKVSLRKKIESKITKILHDEETAQYIQDDFFTIRSERYVVPLKLDGRGRMKGSIYDTSDSGQTLFIEPAGIAPLNEELLELDLSEKLEILRIFRELGELIAQDIEILRANYEELIDLDVLCAQASFAQAIDGSRISLTNEKLIDLKSTRHPLVTSPAGKPAVPNDINLGPHQNTLVISGPNAGGKTVILKTVGLVMVMVKAGLLVPADPESSVYLFDHVFLELGDQQSIETNLSTFSGHIKGLKPIVEKAAKGDLVLLDEIASGTEPQAGSALAQAILEQLSSSQTFTIVTTHFDALKGLAETNPVFRNGSMEYSTTNFEPTYKLISDVPGQSFGIEVAEQLGIDPKVIARAKSLRGESATSLDSLLAKLAAAREQIGAQEHDLKRARIEAETAKARWADEKDRLSEKRQSTSAKLAAQYEELLSEFKGEYLDVVDKLKKKLKHLEKLGLTSQDERDEVLNLRHKAESLIDNTQSHLTGVASSRQEERLPLKDVSVGLRVYVKSLGKDGEVKEVKKGNECIVQVGPINLVTDFLDLAQAVEGSSRPPKKKSQSPLKKSSRGKEIPFTLPTDSNSIHLRGMDAEAAVEAAFSYIDQALLRGEPRIVLIHGHGSNVLKTKLRDVLKNNCPYRVHFRAGEDAEGGDGVTIVALDD